MGPDRTAQSLHPVASPGHSSRKSQPDQYKDHRPTAQPWAAREPWARAISRLTLVFVRLLREGLLDPFTGLREESHPAQTAGLSLAVTPLLVVRPASGRAPCPPLRASALWSHPVPLVAAMASIPPARGRPARGAEAHAEAAENPAADPAGSQLAGIGHPRNASARRHIGSRAGPPPRPRIPSWLPIPRIPLSPPIGRQAAGPAVGSFGRGSRR